MKVRELMKELHGIAVLYGDLEVATLWDDGLGFPQSGHNLEVDLWSDGPNLPPHTAVIVRYPEFTESEAAN